LDVTETVNMKDKHLT